MLKNRNILCIGNPMWEGDYSKTIVELMQVFAEHNKVLYVNNPYTIKDALEKFTKKKAVSLDKALGFRDPLTKININDHTSVHVLTPPLTLTINFLPSGKLYDLLLRFNGWLVKTAIRKSLKRLNMQTDLISIVAFSPALGVTCGRKFNESLLLYHCYDEILAANWLKKHGGELEKKFAGMADAVIVTSQGLLETKQLLNPNCFLVKNGVNYNLFSAAFKAAPHKGKSIVGYVGSIDDRLDYELLEFIVRKLPNVDFVFVGRVVSKQNESQLKQYPNVRFTGPKNVNELPQIIQTFSVGIIPFVKNQFTRGIYPLKINEYLAMGIPVVSSDFSYLSDFEDAISIASTNEAFADAITEAARTDAEDKRLRRQKLAAGNSWFARVAQMSDIIVQLESDLTNQIHNPVSPLQKN